MTETWTFIFQGVVVALLIGGIRGIFGIKNEVSKINGRLVGLTQWRDDHEKLDKERFDNMVTSLERLAGTIGEIRMRTQRRR